VSYEIEIVDVRAVPFAHVKRRGRLDQIGELAMPALDLVWAAVRSASARTGHNVFVYNGTGTDEFDMEMGVQIFSDSPLPPGEIVIGATPAGRAVHTVHVGPYDMLPEASEAMHDWAASEGLELGRGGWEVYGDWAEDPAQLVTDVYLLLAGD
jgi:effector-binding domain-containing protein